MRFGNLPDLSYMTSCNHLLLVELFVLLMSWCWFYLYKEMHDESFALQLEALPIAREQIARLEQKIENLEAILNIKGDYEKLVF